MRPVAFSEPLFHGAGIDSSCTSAIRDERSCAVEIPSGRESLFATDFAKSIVLSRAAVDAEAQPHEVLGLKGAKR